MTAADRDIRKNAPPVNSGPKTTPATLDTGSRGPASAGACPVPARTPDASVGSCAGKPAGNRADRIGADSPRSRAIESGLKQPDAGIPDSRENPVKARPWRVDPAGSTALGVHTGMGLQSPLTQSGVDADPVAHQP